MMRLLTCGLVALILGTAPIVAQDNLFSPRLTINGRVVSNFELEQRVQFLQVLRTPGDLERIALDGLIEDRLRMQEADRLGLTVEPEQLLRGLEEFASRANLSTDQFLQAIAEEGVEAETFRDFVEAGLVWRDVVRARFANKANVTETDVDRALTNLGRADRVRVLLSELILPVEPGAEAEILEQARILKSQISSEARFAEAARTYSAAPSAERGGRMDWVPLANLPGAIGPVVLALRPGQVSDPFPIPGAVALFQLRGLEEISGESPATTQVEYAEFLLPPGADTARIRAEADVCNDLYKQAQGLPANQLRRSTQTMAEVPSDIGMALARLDAGESAVLAAPAGTQRFVMLCNRMPVVEEPPTRDAVRTNLINQRLAGYADGLLADLRANAILTEP